MHVVTHLSEKYENMRTAENGWSVEKAGMAQLDDIEDRPVHLNGCTKPTVCAPPKMRAVRPAARSMLSFRSGP